MKLLMPNMSRKNQQAIRLRLGVVKVPACSDSCPTPPEAKAKRPHSTAQKAEL